MNLLWCDDVDRPEGAIDFSLEALAIRNRMHFVIGNPKGSYEGPKMNSRGAFMELHSQHTMGEFGAMPWSNSNITGTVGIISGFDSEVGVRIAKTSRSAILPSSQADASILFVNGPNLNLLGTREPSIYGDQTLQQIFEGMKTRHPKLNAHVFQSNAEHDLINAIQSATGKFDAIIINAGAYTHTSVAIHDALKSFDDVIIEVHISNPHQREEFRHKSFIAPVSHGLIAGFGPRSYELALMGAMSKL